jgi:hypothetical protein
MKNLIIILNIFLVLNTTAQIPDYFSNNPEWRIDTFETSGQPCGIEKNKVYYLNGDTILNNITYQKLYERGIGAEFIMVPGEDPCNNTWSLDELSAFIRQEFEKIYVLNINSSLEELYYDFSMEVGDTIKGPMAFYLFEETIKAVDSIEIESEYLKRLYYDTIGDNNFFLEGVGNPNGFLEPPQLDISNFSSMMYCYAKNGVVIYVFDGGEELCDFTISVNEYKAYNIELTLFPNPASNVINISLKENVKIKKVKIYEVTGRVVFVQAINDLPRGAEGLRGIDISNLKAGMYLLEVETEDGFREVKRLVVDPVK